MGKTVDNTMPGMTLSNIAKACGGTYTGDDALKEKVIAGAVTDSRQVEKDYLFIPIKGERVDGHDFIPAVFEKGALAVLSEHELQDAVGPYILVDSSTEAMKKIAAFYRTQLKCRVVGITGSVGKTSTKEMIASVLSEKYEVLKTAGNFNNEIGLPLTIFKIRAHHEVAVLEMGISDFGEMHRLSAMAQPDICVITNIGLCHLENLGTRDGILKAKTEMFEHMQPDAIAILNGDDDKLCTKQIVNGRPAIFYGFGEVSGTKNSVYATDIKNLGLEGMRARIHTPQGDFDAQIPIPGEHNVYNALAGTAVGLELGLNTDEIKSGIAKAQTIAGRTNLLKVGGMTVIDDCYNANPVSMKASIDVLAHTKGRRIAVLGDMGELGSDEKAMHYGVGLAVGQARIEALFCAGTLAEEYAKAAAEVNIECEVFYFPNREDMTEALLHYVKEGDAVLVKASHFMEFPKVVEALSALDK
jgi:UDP-N-acetylmuramoyl-tripeptide--D-alanyl-D-alanine ligase